MKAKANKGVIITGGSNNIQNMVTGDNATLNISSGFQGSDFEALTNELSKLRMKLLEVSDNSAESFKDIGAVANAEIASKEKDGSKVLKYLKDVGKWVLDTAKEIGVDVVTDLLKKNLG